MMQNKVSKNMFKMSPKPETKLIRVLIIGLYGSRGGVETSTMNYYRNFNHSIVQYDFINPYNEFYYNDEINTLGGKVFNVNSYRKHPIKYVLDVKRIITTESYDIVNVLMLSAINPLPVIAVWLARVQNVIVHSHNSGASNHLKVFLHIINKPIINAIANYKWACSTEAGEWLFYKRDKLINNAINLNLYRYSYEKRQKIRNNLGLSKGEFVIGNVARLVPEKNHTFLINMFAEFHQSRRNSTLLIIGSGPCLGDLKGLAKDLGVEDSVIFTGDRSDVADIYSAMDVFILPSKFEGLPMVAVEAQAATLPVICSDVVTKEVNITQNVYHLSLEDSKEVWCEVVNSARRISVSRAENLLTAGGYNIGTEARSMEKFYINLKGESND